MGNPIRNDGSIEEVDCGGTLLGVVPDGVWRDERVSLGEGECIVLYTDGVTEAHHRNQPLFGQERLIDVIRRAPADVDAVADAILAAVTAYGPAEPRDDVAVVVGRIDS